MPKKPNKSMTKYPHVAELFMLIEEAERDRDLLAAIHAWAQGPEVSIPDAIRIRLGSRFGEGGSIPDDIRILVHAGKPIEAIKIYRERFGLNLSDAKRVIDIEREKIGRK